MEGLREKVEGLMERRRAGSDPYDAAFASGVNIGLRRVLDLIDASVPVPEGDGSEPRYRVEIHEGGDGFWARASGHFGGGAFATGDSLAQCLVAVAEAIDLCEADDRRVDALESAAPEGLGDGLVLIRSELDRLAEKVRGLSDGLLKLGED